MIIVTGANGFIGSAFVWELNQMGRSDIICVDSISPRQRPQLLASRRYLRFLDKTEIWSFLETPQAMGHVEAIVHMGACSSTTELDVAFLKENNTDYTRRLWDWCTLHKKTFIYASSGSVYGDGNNGFDDATATEAFVPLNPYGESKAAFDRWANAQQTTPPLWFGLRFFNVFGPNEYHKGEMASVVFKAFRQIQATGTLKLFKSHNPKYGDGKQMRDFVYVKDITRWMLELLSFKSGSGVYNLGYGRARTWLDLANATFSTLQRPLQIQWIEIPEEMRPRYQYFTEAKMQRAFEIGLSQPKWPLEKAVADYIENYLQKLEAVL
jgi:ADP-L-glycero-D-manno-heptose 6-epimerase